MNLMTSASSIDHGQEIVRSTIRVVGITLNGGFAKADVDGGSVYISRSAVKRLNLRVGQDYTAELVPNHAQPDRTPWFAMHIVDPEARASSFLPSEVLEHLRSAGDAWTAEAMCEVFLDHEPGEEEVRDMHRILDQLYLAKRGVAKVMMFTEAGAGGPEETWFTAVPEKIDVGEFED